MRFLCLMLVACSAAAQLPVVPFTVPSGASTWYPTNAANPTIIWCELISPRVGTWGPTSATHPAADNTSLALWTNYAASSSVFTADQTLHPTNFLSGGGGNGTSPHVSFTGASDTRMGSGALPISTNKFTVMLVANCTDTSGSSVLFNLNGGSGGCGYSSKSLFMNQGSTLTSAATMGTGYYVITFVFAAGTSSHIDTNGVTMVTGTAGSTISLTSSYFEQNSTARNFNLCRAWVWAGVLGATDLTKAVSQCKTDFGIP